MLLKINVTDAFVTPDVPPLYISSYFFSTLMCLSVEMPMTKQIASKMFDLPDPLSPVIALNSGSKSLICVLTE